MGSSDRCNNAESGKNFSHCGGATALNKYTVIKVTQLPDAYQPGGGKAEPRVDRARFCLNTAGCGSNLSPFILRASILWGATSAILLGTTAAPFETTLTWEFG